MKAGPRPRAVLISDVHYSLSTYQIADKAYRMAIDKACELEVPLIDCGDLTNDKAILRGEVIKTIIDTLKYAEDRGVKVYLLVGNHSLITEKGEEHALHFLEPYATVISHATSVDGFNFIPYQNSCEKMLAALEKFPKGALVFAHQGVQGAWLGDYVQDRTSLPPEAFADYRIISGHYHRAASLKTGRPKKGAVGLFSYVGNPYTLSWGEASDGPKGYQILFDNGLMEHIPTDLRKHVVLDWSTEQLSGVSSTDRGGSTAEMVINPGDLVWLKLRGPASELAQVKKADLAKLLGVEHFKLDKIITETEHLDEEEKAQAKTGAELLDALIDKSNEPAAEKAVQKSLWRELVA